MSNTNDWKLRRISSTAAARQFKQLIRMAQKEPILITHRGHPRLVIVSVREYQRLTRFLLPEVSRAANDPAGPCIGRRAPDAASCTRD